MDVELKNGMNIKIKFKQESRISKCDMNCDLKNLFKMN